MLEKPVLLLVFDRPGLTQRVFDEIRHVRPSKLYVAGDGPRNPLHLQRGAIQEARQIATSVDWDCDVHTLFRDKNLGCKMAVSTAIDWFFGQEDEGIVLEDDCLPNQSFFRYCDELLDRFRDEERVMCISGDNFQQGNSVTSDSYYFSKYNHCWGWATWRRAWLQYDPVIINRPGFDIHSVLEGFSDGSDAFIQYWEAIFEKVTTGEINSWAYYWTLSCWINNGLTCIPDKNLVMNIGFGRHATHTRDEDKLAELDAHEISFPLIHPDTIVRNISADRYTDVNCFGIQGDLPDNDMIATMWKRQTATYISRFLKKLKLV